MAIHGSAQVGRIIGLSSLRYFNGAHSESSYVVLRTHCIITSYPSDHVSHIPSRPSIRFFDVMPRRYVTSFSPDTRIRYLLT